MDEKKQITLGDLAQTLENLTQEMRVGFKNTQEQFVAQKQHSQQGFEMMNTKIDAVESHLNDKIDSVKSELNDKIDSVKSELNDKIDSVKSELNDKIDSTMFTPDEKASILDTVKLVNDHLANNVTGKSDITLIRKEYDIVVKKTGLPNRFSNGGLEMQGA